MRQSFKAFTIVELLVVVTIIVVLLALLAPAMEKAVYQAELVACAARLKAHANSVILYAMDFQRSYPSRPAIRSGVAGFRAFHLAYTGWDPTFDDRPMLRPYMPINKLMSCPFVNEVEFDQAERPGNTVSNVLLWSSYSYWYGYKFIGREGMYRLGNRLEWKEGTTGTTSYFNVMVSDTDFADFGGPTSNSSHPDARGFLFLNTVENTLTPLARGYVTYSMWGYWAGPPARGPLDRNFAFEDNSVQGWNNLVIDDDRLTAIGGHTSVTRTGYGTDTGVRTWLPSP